MLNQNLLEVEPNLIHGQIFLWNKHLEIKSAQMDLYNLYLSIYLSTYLPIYLSTYLPIYLSTYLTIYHFFFLRKFVLSTSKHLFFPQPPYIFFSDLLFVIRILHTNQPGKPGLALPLHDIWFHALAGDKDKQWIDVDGVQVTERNDPSVC